MSKAQHEEEERAEARAAPAAKRLAGLLSVGVTVMGLAIAAVVVMAVLALIGHH